MPTAPRTAARMLHRLTPIARLQWRFAHDRRGRLRVVASLAHLVGTDLALAVAQRLRLLASRPIPIYIDGIVHYTDMAANEIVPIMEIYAGDMYRRVPGFAAEPGQIVVDIGANIGAFTLWQAHRGAQVYALEPNSAPYARLSLAVTHNKLDEKVYCINEAVGGVEGQGTLMVPDMNSTAGQVRTDATGVIPVTTLAALLKRFDLPYVHILKIDAEGSEVSILEGAHSILHLVRRIVLEYHSHSLEDRCRRLLATRDFAIVDQTIIDVHCGAGVLYAVRSDVRDAR